MLTEIQKIILTCLLGRPEDPLAFRKFRQREQAKKRRSVTLEASRERVRNWRRSNLEKSRESSRKSVRRWAKAFPEVVREKARIRRSTTPKASRSDIDRAKQRAYMAGRRRVPEVRLAASLRERVRQLLKGTSKSLSSLRLLGCCIDEYKTYLESKFVAGMTWENYGPVWHVDHIKPCAKFDLADPEQQKACFHWSNTQPLFAAENLAKKDKYVG